MRYINLRFTYLLTYQTCKTTSSLHSYRGNTRTRNFYQKLAPMHVTKIVRFDWSAVTSFWYQKLAQNRAAFSSVQVSVKSFLSVCHPYYVMLKKLVQEKMRFTEPTRKNE